MDKAGIAVVIVTPEAGDLLDRCLGSVARQAVQAREVVVVLNGCGGADELKDKWSDSLPINVISSAANIGFAGAHRLALPHIKARWVALLNADAVAEADWLDELLKIGESGHDIGAVASAVLMAGNPSHLESLGVEVGSSGAAYLRRWGEPYREEAPQEVFGPAGSAAMYRREAIDRVGFFDPELFAYYEDVDLAWRFRMAGWRTMAAPRARAHHKGGGFAKHAAGTFYTQRNRLAVIAMNWPARLILRNFAKIMLIDFASLLLSILKERSIISIKARVSFITMLPGLISKRLKRRKTGVLGVERWLFNDWRRAINRLKWKIS